MAKARFFYALRPDSGAAGELAAIAAQAAARWGGRAFAAPDIHLTLAFMGMQPLEDRPALEAILHGLPSQYGGASGTRDAAADDPPIDDVDTLAALELSRIGSFGHGVLWVGPAKPPGAASPAPPFVHRLARQIRERLRTAGIAFDDRPLKLHATIVRGARGFVEDRVSVTGLPVIARSWSLALGASTPGSTPQRRYSWWGPPATGTPS